MQLPVEAKFRQTLSLGWEEEFELGLPRPPRPPRPPRFEKDDMIGQDRSSERRKEILVQVQVGLFILWA